MPTKEEIIESFKIAANKETWVKNPPEDTQTYTSSLDEAVAKLQEILDDNNPNSYSQKAFDLMELRKGSPALGAATCQALLSHGAPGKGVAVDVSKRVMAKEMERYSPRAGGFIREKHAINGMTKQFLQETAPNYEATIKNGVASLAQKYGKGLETAANGEDWGDKTEITTALGKDMLALMSGTPLPQEAMQYLKELRDTIENDQGFAQKYNEYRPQATQEEVTSELQSIADVVVNNNTALRTMGPELQKIPQVSNNPLWKDASGAALSSFSGARKDAIKPKVKSDPNQLQEGKPRVLTKEEIAENKHLSDISQSIHEGRGMVLEQLEMISNGLPTENESVAQHLQDTEGELPILTTLENKQTAIDLKREQQQREQLKQQQDKATVQPDLDKLANLQAKLEKLETKKPSLGTKFKALFKKDGIEGMKADLRVKIEKTKLDIAGKVDEGQFGARMDMHRDNLKDARRKYGDNVIGAQDYLQAKQEVNRLGSNQGINAMDMHASTQEHTQVNEGLEENLQKMEENRPSYEAFNQASGKISETMKILEHGNKNAVNKPSVGELLRKDHIGGDQTEHKEQVHVGHGTK